MIHQPGWMTAIFVTTYVNILLMRGTAVVSIQKPTNVFIIIRSLLIVGVCLSGNIKSVLSGSLLQNWLPC